MDPAWWLLLAPAASASWLAYTAAQHAHRMQATEAMQLLSMERQLYVLEACMSKALDKSAKMLALLHTATATATATASHVIQAPHVTQAPNYVAPNEIENIVAEESIVSVGGSSSSSSSSSSSMRAVVKPRNGRSLSDGRKRREEPSPPPHAEVPDVNAAMRQRWAEQRLSLEATVQGLTREYADAARALEAAHSENEHLRNFIRDKEQEQKRELRDVEAACERERAAFSAQRKLMQEEQEALNERHIELRHIQHEQVNAIEEGRRRLISNGHDSARAGDDLAAVRSTLIEQERTYAGQKWEADAKIGRLEADNQRLRVECASQAHAIEERALQVIDVSAARDARMRVVNEKRHLERANTALQGENEALRYRVAELKVKAQLWDAHPDDANHRGENTLQAKRRRPST